MHLSHLKLTRLHFLDRLLKPLYLLVHLLKLLGLPQVLSGHLLVFKFEGLAVQIHFLDFVLVRTQLKVDLFFFSKDGLELSLVLLVESGLVSSEAVYLLLMLKVGGR